MDNITNIVYNIKAIDNATATINSVAASLRVLKRLSPINIKINTTYNTKNKITNTLNDVYKANASVQMKVSRTLQDTYKQTQTFQTNVINKNKNIDEQVNKIKNSTSGVKDEAKKTDNWFSKWKKSLSSVIKRFVSLRAISNYIAQGVELSADYIENLHLMEVAFESASAEAFQFGKTISDTFGTSINETNKYLSIFRQMTSAIGIADQTASRMSETLTALGYDIASLYNLKIQSAMEKLEAGIAGQTKPLRTLGMDITAQSLDDYLANTLKLSNVTSKQMTQADKMILRTIVIMEQAQNATGDMAETINTFSNQMKVLKGSIQNFKLAIGDFAQAYLQPLISTLAGIFIAITKIIRAFVPMTDTSGVDNLVNSLKGADEELNEIAKTAGLLSFDKFNALTKNGGENGLTNISDILTEVFNDKYSKYMEDFQNSMNSINNKAVEIARNIINWVFPDAVIDDLGNVQGSLGRVNEDLRKAWITIKVIISFSIAKKLLALSTAARTLSKSLLSAKKSTDLLKNTYASLGAMLAVFSLIEIITKWDEMTAAEKHLAVAGVILGGVIFFMNSGLKELVVTLISKVLPIFGKQFVTMLATNTFALGSFRLAMVATISSMAAFAAGIALAFAVFYNWDTMNGIQKIISVLGVLTVVLLGAALAFGAFHSAWTMGLAVAGIVAGIVAVTASINKAKSSIDSMENVSKFADGGFPDVGQLFIANEAGAELVGNIGGKTGVANNDMIVQALESAAYRGFIRAIDDSGMNAQRSGGNVTLNINGKEFARATAPDMASEFNRRNIKFK